MLAALLLAGLVAAPVSSAALFVPVRPRRRVAGPWPATALVRPRVGSGSVRQAGRVPPDAEDDRPHLVVDGDPGQLGRDRAGRAGRGRHRRGTVACGHLRWTAARRAAAVPHSGPRRGPGQQPGRPAGHAATGPRRAATHRVVAGPAGAWRGRRRDRGRDLGRHRHRRRAAVDAGLGAGPSAAAHRPGPGQGDAGGVARPLRQPRWEPEAATSQPSRSTAPTVTVPPTTAPAPATTTP